MGKTIIYGLLAAGYDAAVGLNAATVAGYLTVSEWYMAVVLAVVALLLHLAFFRNLQTALRMRAIIRAPQRSSRLPAERHQSPADTMRPPVSTSSHGTISDSWR